MNEFFLGILEITAGMSLLILVMLPLLKLIGGKFTAKCRYILWTLVLIRMAVPFSFGILPALIEVPVEREPEPVQIQMQVPTVEYTPVPQNPVTTSPQEPVQMPSRPVQTPIFTEPEPEPITWDDVKTYIPHAYLAGAAVFLLWNLLSYWIYTAKILRSARDADEGTQEIYGAVCRKKELHHPPNLLVSPDVNSPAAFGLLRRRIVLPDIAFTENGLAGTLSHEVTHCRRGDLWIKAISLLARAFHWFNPLVHLVAFRCEMEMELSCDESVLAGCDENTRAAYGEVMLDIIKRCRRNRGALTTHFNPKKTAVKARFTNILYGSGKKRGLWLIAVCLVLCLAAGAIVACRVEAEPEEDVSTIKTEPLPDGVMIRTPVLYGPYNQEMLSDLLTEEIPETEISEILQDTELCGVRVILYLDENGLFCAAYEKKGTLFRFINTGGVKPVSYEAAEFTDILEEDGFSVSWAWSHMFRYYFTVENGTPVLFLSAPDSVTEADYDQDGVTEVICQTYYSMRIYDIKDGELKIVGFDGSVVTMKPGEFYRYLPEKNWFEFDYKKDGDDTLFHRYGVVKDGVLTLVTPDDVVTTLAGLETYRSRGVISEAVYEFYFNLLSGQSAIPEYNTLVIEDYTIRLTDDDRTTEFQFTVKESGMDTLPTGEYQWTIKDLRDVKILNRYPDHEEFYEIPEVKKLCAFLSGTYIYSTPTYGKGYEYPGMHNYICNYYSDVFALEPEEYKRIAREEFGVTDFTPMDLETWTLDDGLIHAGGIGGSWFGEVEDVTEDDTTVTVVMQFYADCNYLLKSHRIAYRFGKDGKWLGYEILVRSAYEPDGLHSLTDSAQPISPAQLYEEFITEKLTPFESYMVAMEYIDLDGNGIDELIVYDWGASANYGIEIFTVEEGEVRSFSTETNVITRYEGNAQALAPPSKNANDYVFWGVPTSHNNGFQHVQLWFVPCEFVNGHVLYSMNGSEFHTSEDYYYFTSDENGYLTVELLMSFYCEAIDSNPANGWNCKVNGEEVMVAWYDYMMVNFWQNLRVSHGVRYSENNTSSRLDELQTWIEYPYTATVNPDEKYRYYTSDNWIVQGSENWIELMNLQNGTSVRYPQMSRRIATDMIDFVPGSVLVKFNDSETILALSYTLASDQRHMGCTIIDLTKEGYPIAVHQLLPDLSQFLEIDVTGSISETFRLSQAAADFTIGCRLEQDFGGINVYFDLTAPGLTITGYYACSAPYEAYRFDLIRAVTGEDAHDLIARYDEAYQVRYWFEGNLQTRATAEDVPKVIDGIRYYPLRNDFFDAMGITDLTTLKAYISTVFTEDMTDELMKNCITENSSNPGMILWADGKLWVADAARGSDSFKVYPEYFVSEKTEGSLTLTCHVYQLDYDPVLEELIPDPTPLEYRYEFVKSGDTWLCGSFPIIW